MTSLVLDFVNSLCSGSDAKVLKLALVIVASEISRQEKSLCSYSSMSQSDFHVWLDVDMSLDFTKCVQAH